MQTHILQGIKKNALYVSQLQFGTCLFFWFLSQNDMWVQLTIQLSVYTLVLGRFLSSKFRGKILISFVPKRSSVGPDWKKIFPTRTFEQVAQSGCKSWRLWRSDWTKPWKFGSISEMILLQAIGRSRDLLKFLPAWVILWA